MFDVGGGELLLIFVAVLLLFGPKKIPEVMRSVGKGLRQFRDAQEGLKQQMRDLSADVEKMTNIEETPVRVTPKKVEEIQIAEVISPNQVSMEIDGQVSMEIENQFPKPNIYFKEWKQEHHWDSEEADAIGITKREFRCSSGPKQG